MPLTDAQREHLADRLREERERALRALNRSLATSAGEDMEDRAGDLTLAPLHRADQGTDAIEEEVGASNDARISRELAEIDAALERLYGSPESFGICEDTGREIPYERLDLIPWARTCAQAEA
jgi:RNA polymerase-binding transcription factor DksA